MYENVDAVFGGTARFLSLVELIYDAAENPSLWNTVMERIAEAVNGEWTVLWPHFSHPAAPNVTAWAGLDPALLVSYAEHLASVNVLAQKIERQQPNAVISYSHELIPDEEFQPTEYCNDFLHANGMFYTFGMKVHLGLEAPAFISGVRPKSSGPFGAREGQVFAALLPHLQRSIRQYLMLSQLRSKANGLEVALNAFDVAVFGLNREGRVVYLNQGAQQFAATGKGIRLSRGRLSAADAAQNRELHRLLSGGVAAADGRGLPSGWSMLLQRSQGKRALTITVMPSSCGTQETRDEIVALIFVADSESRRSSRSETLQSLYGLSPSECRVVDLLCAGCEITEIAAVLRLTVETARFHLKSIYRKTGSHRQAALVRLISALPADMPRGTGAARPAFPST